MNPRLKKELRALLPMFGATTLIVVVLSILCDGHDAPDIVATVFRFCCVAIGAASFGHEFESKTMVMLLAQPISRRQIWREKLLAQAITLIAAFSVAVLSILTLIRGSNLPENSQAIPFWQVCLQMLVMITGVLCTSSALTLAARNLLIGGVLSLGVPMGIMFIFLFILWAGSWLTAHPGEPLLADWADQHVAAATAGVSVVTIIYFATTYRFGYRYFMRFEAVASQGKELALPAKMEIALGSRIKKFLPGYTNPVASLIRKELQLHRVSFTIGALACVMLPIEALMAKLHPSELSTTLFVASLAIYALSIPIITGVVVLAEERNWGTLGWQLSLPVSPLKQWIIKLGVALSTAVALGIVVPLVILFAGGWIDPGHIYDSQNHLGGFLLSYLLAFSLFVFVSSMANSTIQAMTFLVGLLAGFGAVCALTVEASGRLLNLALLGMIDAGLKTFNVLPELYRHYVLTIMTLGLICVLLGMFCFMAFTNYRKGEINPRRCWIQVAATLIMGAVLSVFVTTL